MSAGEPPISQTKIGRTYGHQRETRRSWRQFARTDVILVAPTSVLLGILFLYPLVQTAIQSVQVADGVSFSQYRVAVTEPPFSTALRTTFSIALEVTAACAVLGMLTAYWISKQPRRVAASLLALVIVPLWISLLVRTFAWVLDLQPSGPLSWIFGHVGLGESVSGLLYHRGAVLLGMTQVLLPFMILPVYNALKGVDPTLGAAAQTLGAGPIQRLRLITLPLIAPAVGAGCLLVFVMSLGYFITPALLGGPETNMISNMIWNEANQTGNLTLASALAIVLLVITALVVMIAGRFVPITTAIAATEAPTSGTAKR